MFGYNIFLIGFMGTGKSTIASCFAEKSAMEIIEMDEAIAEKEGMSIPDIFAQHGEEYFRNLETAYLKEIEGMTRKIISCGGGAVLREENVSVMKESGRIVLLTASSKVIFERVKNDNGRPLLKGRKSVEAIEGLVEARRAKYEDAADIIIHIDGKSKEVICEEIVNKLQRMKEGKENV